MGDDEPRGQTGMFPNSSHRKVVRRSAVFREPSNRESWGAFRLSGLSISYFSPILFFPSIMTLLNIRLIRVW